MIPHVVHALMRDEKGDQCRELDGVENSQTSEGANVLMIQQGPHEALPDHFLGGEM
jgi:hypothetical protein